MWLDWNPLVLKSIEVAYIFTMVIIVDNPKNMLASIIPLWTTTVKLINKTAICELWVLENAYRKKPLIPDSKALNYS